MSRCGPGRPRCPQAWSGWSFGGARRVQELPRAHRGGLRRGNDVLAGCAHNAFLEQFLEPLARYKSVVVKHLHVVLVHLYLPPADTWSAAWGSLHLELGVDEGLSAVPLRPRTLPA